MYCHQGSHRGKVGMSEQGRKLMFWVYPTPAEVSLVYIVLHIFCWCSLPIFLVLYSFSYNFNHVASFYLSFLFFTLLCIVSQYLFSFTWQYLSGLSTIIILLLLWLKVLFEERKFTSIISDFLSELFTLNIWHTSNLCLYRMWS